MDITLYDEFIELAKQLNFTEASKRLNVTQSALSKHISALEKKYGVQFFHRNRKSVTLSEEGRILYAHALTISEAYHLSLKEVSDYAKCPPIRVTGILHNQEIVCLLSFALQLSETENGRLDQITPIISDHHYQLLAANKVDICIIPQPPEAQISSEFLFEDLYQDRFIAVVSRTHSLSGKKETSFHDLKNEEFLRLSSDYSESAWQCIASACKIAGYQPKTVSRMIRSSLEYVTVSLGEAVYIVPQTSFVTSALCHNPELTALKVIDDYAVFPIGIVYKKENQERLASFIECLHKASKKMIEKASSIKLEDYIYKT